MSFVLSISPAPEPRDDDLVVVVQGDRLLARVETSGALQFPSGGQVRRWTAEKLAPLGRLEGCACWSASIADPATTPLAGWEWWETRSLLSTFSLAQMHAVSSARELHWWQARNRFCGCCGTPTVDLTNERAKKCPQCGAMFFPGAYPAIIVAVTRGDRILLAHNSNFRPNMHSLLAGFVDPGETLEQAAVREVREEVGIEIGGLRYVSSQPWPFPNSLMLGFRAEYVSGELRVDGKEIETADWFTKDRLPEIPRAGTVARSIIDAWVEE